MPTLPDGHGSDVEPLDLHHAREMAQSFGIDAQGYDAARPSYPDELVRRIVNDRAGLSVLDVGCGTGIAARQFQAAGCCVLGIEPDSRMAHFARASGLTVELGTFESWDPAGRTFDVVAAAQAWHWVDPAAGAQKAAKVLRPGGRLAIFGHVYEPPDAIAQAFSDAFRRAVPDSPFHGQGRRSIEIYQAGYDRIADTLRETDLFDHVDLWRFDWTRSYQRDEWLALLTTTGGLAPLPVETKAEILHAVGLAIDARGGSFTMEYVTLAASGRRTTTAFR